MSESKVRNIKTVVNKIRQLEIQVISYLEYSELAMDVNKSEAKKQKNNIQNRKRSEVHENGCQ